MARPQDFALGCRERGAQGGEWETPSEAGEETSFPSNKNSRSCQVGGDFPCGGHLFALEGLKAVASGMGWGGPGGLNVRWI